MENLRNKKGITKVITVSLLIVILVVAVVVFSGWIKSYLSNLQSKTEIQSSNSIQLDIQLVQKTSNGLNIYVKNPSNIYTRLNQVKVNGIICNLLSSDVITFKSVTQVDVDCNVEKGKIADITLITKNNLFSKKLLVK